MCATEAVAEAATAAALWKDHSEAWGRCGGKDKCFQTKHRWLAQVCGRAYLKTAESGCNPDGCIRFWLSCDTCKAFKKSACRKNHGAAEPQLDEGQVAE